MEEKKAHAKNNLRGVVQISGLSIENFDKKHNIPDNTLKSYLNGNRSIPINTALEFAEVYGVSLDWLYGKTKFLSDLDRAFYVLAKLMKIESKLLKTKIEGELYVRSESSLYVDERLYNFFLEIQRLENQRQDSCILEEKEYEVKYRRILSQYTGKLKGIIDQPYFAEGKQIEIDDIEFIFPADEETSTIETEDETL